MLQAFLTLSALLSSASIPSLLFPVHPPSPKVDHYCRLTTVHPKDVYLLCCSVSAVFTMHSTEGCPKPKAAPMLLCLMSAQDALTLIEATHTC